MNQTYCKLLQPPLCTVYNMFTSCADRLYPLTVITGAFIFRIYRLFYKKIYSVFSRSDGSEILQLYGRSYQTGFETIISLTSM